ncbi:glycine reductase complex selenoprotein A [Halanaerobium praevalens DSM 2228]|uniref:Glycine reductase complex selenoprotein A n=3 Tax=Halanaerobium praevalens TaxID=2331 RepID=E3DNY2_HALPG|nr:glycine reductase complex selenoprotein A [Halanaerobium praevalens DSM 2228]
MDLENQQRIKDLAEKEGAENLVVILGGAEAEASGLACETVTNGDPTFAGPLAGVQLGLACYHVVEAEVKKEIDSEVYEEQISMMEMVIDVDAITEEVKKYRDMYSEYKL